jgi:alanyl-tRNA synthetase
MMMMPSPRTGDEVREAFLRFFEERGHLRMPAASLIPAGDPTLLLTNSGMAQFKAYFAGEAVPPSPRMTTAQKSFRTVDIEVVGDATHLTLFEMLGNFSFGDYFKKEACAWALELMVGTFGFPLERLYFTVYEDDDEAVQVWRNLGIPPERIYRFGAKDNFWGPAGAEGPCGPCSEVHYYRGDLRNVPPPNDQRRASWGPNLSPEFVELYNLVFTQFYHHLDGRRTELPKRNIDTGMGLERTIAALQGVKNVYETDIFLPLIHRAERLAGVEWGGDPKTDRALAVIVEHSRSAAFLIGDGVVPGNTGRGYVLRRLIRRGIRFGRQLGLQGPFLSDLATAVVDRMGHAYRELVDHRPFIVRVLELEEKRFAATVDQGTGALEEMAAYRKRAGTAPGVRPGTSVGERVAHEALAAAGSDPDALRRWEEQVSGREAFFLYDTLGFPVELTTEIAAEAGLAVDVDGFEREMEAQRERGRASGAHFGGGKDQLRIYEELGVDETPFLGYQTTTAESVVVGIIKNGAVVQTAGKGDEVEVVLRETPFYPEGGGQVGDSGRIAGPEGAVEVADTQRPWSHMIVHRGVVAEGSIALGAPVKAEVDRELRERTMRNHTATHLLHAALREVLGSHVRQAGSLVAPDRLRFDFTHVAAVTRDEMLKVQRIVNDKIRHNLKVHKHETTYRDAIAAGALAFFGDKYDHAVRTVMIANAAPFSYELCGGTHVDQTGDIGAVFIVSESSIGAGLRRLEAVTGQGAEELIASRLEVLDQLTQKLQAPPDKLPARAAAMLDELESARRRLAELERDAARQSAGALLAGARDIDGLKLLVARTDATNADTLRETGDWLRDKLGTGIVVLGGVFGDRPMVIAMVSKDLAARGYDAVAIARGAGQVMGGGAGGRPEVAQAGGKDAAKLDDALKAAEAVVRTGPAGPAPGGGKAGGARGRPA